MEAQIKFDFLFSLLQQTFSVSVLQWWEAAPFKLTLLCDDKLCTLLCLVSICVYMCGGTLEMEDDTH